MSCYVVVRRARPEDEAARAALLRDCTHEYFLDAFLMFFFHELTLQCVVLGGAVLFIFCGASVTGSACVAPAAAAAVGVAVLAAHEASVRRQRVAAAAELAGWVAEARGEPHELEREPTAHLPLYSEEQARRRDAPVTGSEAARVVATVSLSEWRGAEARGWLHALAVARRWRRRGLARALAGAAGGAAHAAGLRSAEAVASALQGAARGALQAAGWSLRGSYERALLGDALTLPMVQLGRDFASP